MFNHPKINPNEKGKKKLDTVDENPMTSDSPDRQYTQGGDKGPERQGITSGCLSSRTICRYINCGLVDMPRGSKDLSWLALAK